MLEDVEAGADQRSAFDGHRVAKFGNGGDLKPLARVASARMRHSRSAVPPGGKPAKPAKSA